MYKLTWTSPDSNKDTNHSKPRLTLAISELNPLTVQFKDDSQLFTVFYEWLIAMEDPVGKKEEKVVGWQQSKAQISVGY